MEPQHSPNNSQTSDNEPYSNSSNSNDHDMSKPKRKSVLLFLISFIAIVIIVFVGYWLLRDTTTETPETSGSPIVEFIEPAYVTITNDGFVPETLKVAVGQSVIWTNEDAQPHAISSDPHPEHTSLPSLNSDVIDQDSTYQYEFMQAGTYNYHDELDPSVTGTIIVEQ